MSSNFSLIIIFILLVAGCGLQTGEKAPEQAAPSYSGKGYSCVGEIPQHISKYINDELTIGQVNDFTRCLQKSFASFAELTRGRDETTYAPEELRRFLQTYFIHDHVMSDELMHQFMVIKTVLIGGDANRVSRQELYLAIDLLEDIRKEAVRLHPFIQFLNPTLAKKQDPVGLGANLSKAFESLSQTIHVFSSRFEKSKSAYAYSDLEKFMTEFRSFINWESEFPGGYKVSDWTNLIRIFKELTVSPLDPEVINVSDWAPLMESGARWYLAYLQFEVGVREQPVLYGVGLQNLLFLGEELFKLIDSALQKQPEKSISLSQLDRLIESLSGIRWMPSKLRAASISQAIRPLFQRIFGDELTAPSSRIESGLTLSNLAVMKAEFYRWSYVQLNLDSQFKTAAAVPSEFEPFVPSLQGGITRMSAFSAASKGVRGSEWEEFNKVKTLMRPLFNENDWRVQLVSDQKVKAGAVQHGFANLSAMNMLRGITAMIFRGYSEATPGRGWNSGIGRDELQQFYTDFSLLAVDVGFVDERSVGAGRRSFIEGNLFNYASDGLPAPGDKDPPQLKFVEAMQMFAFFYSGGQVSSKLYAQLKDLCPHGGEDINHRLMYSRDCVIVKLPEMLEAALGNAPDLVKYLKSMNENMRLEFSEVLVKTAFVPNISQLGFVESSELTTMSVVLQYAEAIMTRFDANEDGWLDDKEVHSATPLFTGFIQTIAKDTCRGDLDQTWATAVFRYILFWGHMPEAWDIVNVWNQSVEMYTTWNIGFGPFDVGIKPPPITLSRSSLGNVFSSIIQQLYASSAKKVCPAKSP